MGTKKAKITKAHKSLKEDAVFVSKWGNAEDFANQVISLEKLKDEWYIKNMLAGRLHFAYGTELVHFLDGLDLTNKEELVDFYNQVVSAPTINKPTPLESQND